MPRSTSAAVTGPVPGPSSTSGPGTDGSTSAAAARASRGPLGIIAAVTKGARANERRKTVWSDAALLTTLSVLGGVIVFITKFVSIHKAVNRDRERGGRGEDED